MTEIKKVQVVEQKNGETTPAKSAEAKKAEETSMLSDIISGAQTTVGYIKEYSGWDALTKAQDRADARVELVTKETDGKAYIPALLGNAAAQPTDVVSFVNEKITDQTEKVDSAVEEVAQSTTSDAGKAGTDLLKAVASPLKLVNGVLNIGGGSSDVVSHYAKGGELNNDVVKESTAKSQQEIADSLKDFSIANINDKKTVIDVGTRLGFTEEQLAAYEKEHGTDGVRALIQKEYDAQLATGKITRETVLMTAANAAQEKLVEKNADLLVHQKDEGVDKLDKGQRQVREAVSEALNIGGATLDLANSGIHAGVKAIAGETAAEIADAPLQFVAGTLQVLTTSFDGKDGTTKAALNKMTFGLFEETEAEEKLDKMEDFADDKKDALDDLRDEIADMRSERADAAEAKSGFLGIGAKDAETAEQLAERDKAIKEKVAEYEKLHAEHKVAVILTKQHRLEMVEGLDANHPEVVALNKEIAQLNDAEKEAMQRVLGQLYPEKQAATPTKTLEEVKAEFKETANAEFKAQKEAAMTSGEAILSRAKETVEIQKSKILAEAQAKIDKLAPLGPTVELAQAHQELAANTKAINENYDKAVAAVAKNLTPEVMKQRMADAEATALKLKQDGKVDEWDAQRLAFRAENAQVSRKEDGTKNETLEAFWNDIDGTYSNADNSAGARGFWANATSIGKGFLYTPARALLKEGVTTLDKAAGAVVCPEIAGSAITGYTAVKKFTEGGQNIYKGTYNSAQKQNGYEKLGEGAFYATASVAQATSMSLTDGHCWHFKAHGERYHFGCGGSHKSGILPLPKPSAPVVDSACDILIKNPAALVVAP